MEDQALLVFALDRDAPPLRLLRDALLAEGRPAGISLGIAGDATDEELDAPEWEAAFVRWKEPEVHEVWLIERALFGEDEEADNVLAENLERVNSLPESAGKLIVADHLRSAKALYVCQLLPAMFDDEDHPAWDALDDALRTLAENTNGIIYGAAEGFYDTDGEMLLDEAEDEDEV